VIAMASVHRLDDLRRDVEAAASIIAAIGALTAFQEQLKTFFGI